MIPLTQKQIDQFIAEFPIAQCDEPMSQHTYLKIGGSARLFIEDGSIKALEAINIAKALGIPWCVIGGGSNILVSDEGFEGVVIHMRTTTNVRITDPKSSNLIPAPAGLFTASLARVAAQVGFTGFEWGAGLPGSIGGAVYGNAGCFGGEMKDVVVSVDAYDVMNSKREKYTNEQCRFGYRDSRFKHEPHVILGVVLRLKPCDPKESMEKVQEIMAKRKDTQPQGAFSAGCLFKNFEFQDESELSVADRHLQIPEEMRKNKRIAAGWLIDQAGLKGKTIGKAQVSLVHGNFLINLGGARAQDVIALSSLVKTKIRDEYGILLEDEVQLVGF